MSRKIAAHRIALNKKRQMNDEPTLTKPEKKQEGVNNDNGSESNPRFFLCDR